MFRRKDRVKIRFLASQIALHNLPSSSEGHEVFIVMKLGKRGINEKVTTKKMVPSSLGVEWEDTFEFISNFYQNPKTKDFTKSKSISCQVKELREGEKKPITLGVIDLPLNNTGSGGINNFETIFTKDSDEKGVKPSFHMKVETQWIKFNNQNLTRVDSTTPTDKKKKVTYSGVDFIAETATEMTNRSQESDEEDHSVVEFPLDDSKAPSRTNSLKEPDMEIAIMREEKDSLQAKLAVLEESLKEESSSLTNKSNVFREFEEKIEKVFNENMELLKNSKETKKKLSRELEEEKKSTKGLQEKISSLEKELKEMQSKMKESQKLLEIRKKENEELVQRLTIQSHDTPSPKLNTQTTPSSSSSSNVNISIVIAFVVLFVAVLLYQIFG